MRSFFQQSHLQHVSIIGLLALAFQTRLLISEPEKPLHEDISQLGWPPPYMTQLMDELDVNSAELTQYAQFGNDFWSSQLKLMPTFQRTIVMGLATIILTPSGSNINPNRYTPWLRYWANELNIDYLTMSHWMEAQGSKQINYLLARGFRPSEF
ncbi:hypothetical protein GCM10027592_57460 [Spirosoma flavus]